MFHELDTEYIPNIKFDIVLNLVNKPAIRYGSILHNSVFVLNKMISKIQDYGSEVFIHKNKDILEQIKNKDFEYITNEIDEISKNKKKNKDISASKTKLKEYIKYTNDSFFEFFENKWYYKNFSESELIRKKIESEKKNISKQTDNITYIYACDLIKTNILEIFRDIQNQDAKNICIKMLTTNSTVSYDILRIIKYMFTNVYIFKSDYDSQIKDSWYIIATNINKEKLNFILSKLSGYFKNPNLLLKSILEFDTEESSLLDIYREFNLKVSKIVNQNIKKFI